MDVSHSILIKSKICQQLARNLNKNMTQFVGVKNNNYSSVGEIWLHDEVVQIKNLFAEKGHIN